MLKATSKKYPSLFVYAAGVKFTDGEAEVTEEQAAKLRKLPEASGVTVETSKRAATKKADAGGSDG